MESIPTAANKHGLLYLSLSHRSPLSVLPGRVDICRARVGEGEGGAQAFSGSVDLASPSGGTGPRYKRI